MKKELRKKKLRQKWINMTYAVRNQLKTVTRKPCALKKHDNDAASHRDDRVQYLFFSDGYFRNIPELSIWSPKRNSQIRRYFMPGKNRTENEDAEKDGNLSLRRNSYNGERHSSDHAVVFQTRRVRAVYLNKNWDREARKERVIEWVRILTIGGMTIRRVLE